MAHIGYPFHLFTLILLQLGDLRFQIQYARFPFLNNGPLQSVTGSRIKDVPWQMCERACSEIGPCRRDTIIR